MVTETRVSHHYGSNDPAMTAQKFYSQYFMSGSAGLPTETQLASFKPYISTALYQSLEAAKKRQLEEIKRYPDEKPSLVDGDLFSSLFEGPTSVDIPSIPVLPSANSVTLQANFTRTEQGKDILHWSDEIKMIKQNDNWVIDDLVYKGNWEFAAKNTLKKTLSNQ
ncbi:DUF3828 domain-containing protein [Budviciaceae bacterium BWR-B9]|uniref:DUF3828 domain-containing protein n=1 Tax=Limnobaculum allomyrinae TaxID=2791986 RepID=A0ABS1ISU8_9GAMM|nr:MULTISPECIES: DUF3828 domain-containing protein [Limnobaculum]MBK5144836.1 DUF3828 domain-containing protein [Limnobaculum allomyrinae]MBV7692499.1 DUF3828 domain-containing protein [Limnobaculum sp. M2-1]